MPTPRQTISYLTHRFRERGMSPDGRLGQNFLVDLNLLDVLADAADIREGDVVLEVGTGTGSLTGVLAARAGHVVTVEVDSRLYDLAQENLAEFDNVTMLRHDALKNKNRVHPNVLSTVGEAMERLGTERFHLAANLPYNIATPLMASLLESTPRVTSMTVTIQKELGDRIAAQPRTRDYSGLSVWMQAQCDVELVRVLGNQVFWPRPKVQSAIIRVVPVAEKRERITDLAFFHQFARAMFFHRRKLLRGVLASAYKSIFDKPVADSILEEQGLDAQTRAEELSIEQLIALAETVRRRVLELDPDAQSTWLRPDDQGLQDEADGSDPDGEDDDAD